VLHAVLEPTDGESLSGTRVVAFAGIGRPEKFFASLRRLGATLVLAQSFADHHRFRESEIARLRETAEYEQARLVTTAKDWVRLPSALRVGIEVLDVEIRWRDRSAVEQLLSDGMPRRHDGSDPGTAGG
jgi:tetraacyldisaccharide 4'-kinase